MNLELLKRVGLDRRLGFKVKSAKGDQLFISFAPQWNCWIDRTANGIPIRNGDIGALEELEAAAEVFDGEIIAFGCCCRVCAADTNLIAASLEFYQTVGDMVSHGYWPEHQAAELARLADDCRRERELENPS